MKIAVVNTEKDRGGAARIAAMLTAEYNKVPSVTATMYHAGSNSILEESFQGVKYSGARQINAAAFRMSGRDALVPLDLSARLGKLIADCDVMHLHNPHGYYIDYVQLLKIWGGKPIVWTWHDAWGATGRCAYPQDCANWNTGCKSCPNMDFYPASYNDKAAQNYTRRFQSFARVQNLKIVSPSEWLASIATQRGYTAEQVHVVSNPVDIDTYARADRYKSREVLGLPQERKVFLFIAAQCDDPRKGYLDFCHATENISALCIAIGHYPQQRGDHVVHTGNVQNVKTMCHYYAAADVLVVPSFADNYPNVVLEAIASGTPVIGYEAGGLLELLSLPYSVGVDAGDKIGLAGALQSWLDKEYDGDEVSLVLKQKAKELWQIETVARQYLKLMGLE